MPVGDGANGTVNVVGRHDLLCIHFDPEFNEGAEQVPDSEPEWYMNLRDRDQFVHIILPLKG